LAARLRPDQLGDFNLMRSPDPLAATRGLLFRQGRRRGRSGAEGRRGYRRGGKGKKGKGGKEGGNVDPQSSCSYVPAFIHNMFAVYDSKIVC